MARRDTLIVGGLRGGELDLGPAVDLDDPSLDGIDLVVHADYGPETVRKRNVVDLTADDWHRACDVPLERAVRLAQRVHPHLAAQRGTMVFVVPMIASAGAEGFVPFATAAEGVRILAKSLAKTWGGDGIRVHSVTVDPHLFLADEDADGIAEANALHDHPLGFVPGPADLGPIIEWLADDASAALTGASLVVDGGLWMPG